MADFLTLPEIESLLFLHADWQEPEIHYAFCRAFVSSCDQGIITAGLDMFMLHAKKYELHSGKPCDDLICKLEALLSSQLPTPWLKKFHVRCHPEFAISEADTLLFCAVIFGLHLFFEQVIDSLPPQDVVTTLNSLSCANVLGCYHSYAEPATAEAVTFLCRKGANLNEIVGTNPSHVADQKTTTLDRTIWELYLHESQFDIGHHYFRSAEAELGPKDSCIVMERLIESGADLECKIPQGCTGVQQAIERRLEADYMRLNDETMDLVRSRVKAALSKRGFIWVEASHST